MDYEKNKCNTFIDILVKNNCFEKIGLNFIGSLDNELNVIESKQTYGDMITNKDLKKISESINKYYGSAISKALKDIAKRINEDFKDILYFGNGTKNMVFKVKTNKNNEYILRVPFPTKKGYNDNENKIKIINGIKNYEKKFGKGSSGVAVPLAYSIQNYDKDYNDIIITLNPLLKPIDLNDKNIELNFATTLINLMKFTYITNAIFIDFWNINNGTFDNFMKTRDGNIVVSDSDMFLNQDYLRNVKPNKYVYYNNKVTKEIGDKLETTWNSNGDIGFSYNFHIRWFCRKMALSTFPNITEGFDYQYVFLCYSCKILMKIIHEIKNSKMFINNITIHMKDYRNLLIKDTSSLKPSKIIADIFPENYNIRNSILNKFKNDNNTYPIPKQWSVNTENLKLIPASTYTLPPQNKTDEYVPPNLRKKDTYVPLHSKYVNSK